MEEFKDITEHQLNVGEIGVYKGAKYIAYGLEDCRDCAFYDTAKKRCTTPSVMCTTIIFKEVTKENNTATICCERFKELIPLFSWFTANGDTLIMPNIDNIRINYCPSCGKYTRDIKLPKELALKYK